MSDFYADRVERSLLDRYLADVRRGHPRWTWARQIAAALGCLDRSRR
jgi:hypothetical protein